MHRLHRDVLMIERRLADAVRNLHEVQRFPRLLENDFHFVADAPRANEAPVGKPPPLRNFFESLIDGKTADNEFTARSTAFKEVERLDRRDKFICLHAGLPLLQDLHDVIHNEGNIFHGQRVQPPERPERVALGTPLQFAVDGEGKAQHCTIHIFTVLNALEHGTDERVLCHHSAMSLQNVLCQTIHFFEAGRPHGAPQLSESNTLDLTDAFPRHIEVLANFLQCLLLGPLEGEALLNNSRFLVREDQEEITQQLIKI